MSRSRWSRSLSARRAPARRRRPDRRLTPLQAAQDAAEQFAPDLAGEGANQGLAEGLAHALPVRGPCAGRGPALDAIAARLFFFPGLLVGRPLLVGGCLGGVELGLARALLGPSPKRLEGGLPILGGVVEASHGAVRHRRLAFRLRRRA